MDDLIQKPKKLKLYNALNIGYLRNEKKQRKRLKKFGYVLDPELTNREHLVAYNPFEQKLLYVSNGTDPTDYRDWYQDLRGLTNTQKSTRRYQDEKNALMKAKNKYNEKSTTLVSHSLGSQFTNTIASRDDNVIQYNPFLMPNTRPRENVQNIRTPLDPVSIFAPSENTRTISAGGNSLLRPHRLDNIRNEPIFI